MGILLLTLACFQRFNSLTAKKLTQYLYFNHPNEIKYIIISAKHSGTQTHVLNGLG